MLGEADGAEEWPLKRRLCLIRLALGLAIGKEQAVERALKVLREPSDHHAIVDLDALEFDGDPEYARKGASLREISGFWINDSHCFVLDLLLRHAPEQTPPVLMDWLDQPERLILAVRCLRHLGQHAEEVTAALHKVVESGDIEGSELSLHLLEEAKAIDGRVVEILIRQMLGEGSNRAPKLLAQCARSLPGVTTAIRKAREAGQCGEDSHLSTFLGLAGPVDGDALELLLDMGMGSPHTMHLEEVRSTWMRSTGDAAALWRDLSRRFLVRWNPTTAYETLDHDNVAAVLGVDTGLRAAKLRTLLDPLNPAPASEAIGTLSALGVFNAEVESLTWTLLETPIDLKAEDRWPRDPTVPALLRSEQRVRLVNVMHEHRGASERLGRAALAIADTPGLQFWRRRTLTGDLPSVSPWEGPTAEWIAKHLAAAPLEEVADHARDFIRDVAIPNTLRVRTILTALGALPGSRIVAVGELAAWIGEPGAPELAGTDEANVEKWRVRDIDEPGGRTAFFDWAERLNTHVPLDEALWSLGELTEPALPIYRHAMAQGVGDVAVELNTVLRRRPTEGPLGGPPRDRLVNFAREWLTYRLLKRAGR